MRKFLLSVLVIILSLQMIISVFATTYCETYDEAIGRAVIEHKPLMLVFYSDYCGWCKRLESDILQTPEVTELSKNFICIRINIKTQPKIAEKYFIRGVPSIIYTNVQNSHRFQNGYLPLKDFIDIMKQDLELLRKIEKGELK